MLKVGDTLFQFDENHRVYRHDEKGRPLGGPVYSEHFVPFTIRGETKFSWLTGYRGDIKVNKKTLRSSADRGYLPHQWYTVEERDGMLWLAEHRHKIIRRLEGATLDQLKQVAAIVGYQDA